MGPSLQVSDALHAMKYRGEGEDYRESGNRFCNAVKDNDEHFNILQDIHSNMRFLWAGRVQAAMGSPRRVTPYNCFVSGTISDSMEGIMQAALEAAQTMRLGGGIGYDFSTLRPSGAHISTLDSVSSGPLAFMDVFDQLCKTIISAGMRRGAQMAVMRVDHPDIEAFVRSKNNETRFTQFNISVGVTDEFMSAVYNDQPFELRFEGQSYGMIDAAALWEEIMRSTYDWAEPGVLFIDTINRMNNLHYCETISATNPCGEQPLPPYGACLLGSVNMTAYVVKDMLGYRIDEEQLRHDIPHIVRATDNVIDRAIYPLVEHEMEAKKKRRMGLGVTGIANAIETLGHSYGSYQFRVILRRLLGIIRDVSYETSVSLAIEKGPFPLFDAEQYGKGEFIQTLPLELQDKIKRYGIRNSHLTSIAPTGTISLCADNVSSGIEPVFAVKSKRKIKTQDGEVEELMEDYGRRVFSTVPKISSECTVDDHVSVLVDASQMVDSAVSKTCIIGEHTDWNEFKDIYWKAWEGGAKGCTTYNPWGKRNPMMKAVPPNEDDEGGACYFNPENGERSCDQ